MIIQKYINLYLNKIITKCVKATLYKQADYFWVKMK